MHALFSAILAMVATGDFVVNTPDLPATFTFHAASSTELDIFVTNNSSYQIKDIGFRTPYTLSLSANQNPAWSVGTPTGPFANDIGTMVDFGGFTTQLPAFSASEIILNGFNLAPFDPAPLVVHAIPPDSQSSSFWVESSTPEPPSFDLMVDAFFGIAATIIIGRRYRATFQRVPLD